mmetsp:Transcript_13116/g.31286  ORF Transcript_13116/g.31286 Transcript_13116/m.31286 type:complete len:240 (-) Transcript_13116:1065-1784(-)
MPVAVDCRELQGTMLHVEVQLWPPPVLDSDILGPTCFSLASISVQELLQITIRQTLPLPDVMEVHVGLQNPHLVVGGIVHDASEVIRRICLVGSCVCSRIWQPLLLPLALLEILPMHLNVRAFPVVLLGCIGPRLFMCHPEDVPKLMDRLSSATSSSQGNCRRPVGANCGFTDVLGRTLNLHILGVGVGDELIVKHKVDTCLGSVFLRCTVDCFPGEMRNSRVKDDWHDDVSLPCVRHG